jgi:hypothetical protein
LILAASSILAREIGARPRARRAGDGWPRAAAEAAVITVESKEQSFEMARRPLTPPPGQLPWLWLLALLAIVVFIVWLTLFH